MGPPRSSVCVCLLLAGCHEPEPSEVPPQGCTWPNRMHDGACLEPGVQDDGCPAGTTGMEDGSCGPAGIGPDLYSHGFSHDGDVGCVPVLPVETCRPGTLAIPGDPSCRPIWECGSGTWGSLETDATTEHVDIGYAGTDSDGSALKPWTSISEAVAAAPGARVAIAAGTYTEDIVLAGEA